MATHKGKFVMGGVEAGPTLNAMEAGDELQLLHGFGKVTRLRIKESYTYRRRRVYVTDKMGIVYGDELAMVSLPTWHKAAEKESQVI
ncbi:hypothetical protein [Salinithrix halophila]|uniref:Uncharacterized protein n=1 Tax=Salinithrix halophila TaxID=1485204 RepID=A0ABV8JHR8_9BACL